MNLKNVHQEEDEEIEEEMTAELMGENGDFVEEEEEEEEEEVEEEPIYVVSSHCSLHLSGVNVPTVAYSTRCDADDVTDNAGSRLAVCHQVS